MTTQEKLIKRNQSLLELAEYLQDISQACKINGVSRQHFYDIKKAYEEHGLEGLREKSRRKPCIKSRVAPEVEETVVKIVYEFLVYGQDKAINELRKKGILVCGEPHYLAQTWIKDFLLKGNPLIHNGLLIGCGIGFSCS